MTKGQKKDRRLYIAPVGNV